MLTNSVILAGFTGLTLWVLKNEYFQRVQTKKPQQTPLQNVVSQEVPLNESGGGTVLRANASVGYHSIMLFTVYSP